MDEIKVVLQNDKLISGASVPVKSTYDAPETEQRTSIDTKQPVGDIDTAAPFESVKEAVSRFGGVVDRKRHKVQYTEKRMYEEQQLEKTSDEIELIKKKCEAAEKAKLQVVKELDSTNRLIEELNLNLERAKTKEHVAAVSELETVKNKLENVRKDYDLLVSEKDIAVKRAQEAVSASKDAEEKVENLTIQLMMTKESLESTNAAYLEAVEHGTGAAMAREQDALNWEQELEQSQEELDQLNRQINSFGVKKSKLDTATAFLHDLKTKLAAYKESKLTGDDPQNGIQAVKKNVEDVKQKVAKAIEEIDYLKTAVSSLKIELKRQKTALEAVRQREGMAEVEVASLEAELNRTMSETVLVRSKEKEAREKMVELLKQLKKAAQEVVQAKSRAQEAREELQKAKETVEQAKAGASSMASRLLAAQKEIEAAKASENVGVLHRPQNEPETGVTLSLEEYYELRKRAHEAEEVAHARVSEAISLFDVAKKSESKRLSKLEQVTSELAARKRAFDAALQKAEKAKQGKLGVEQDLRTWRAEHAQRRKSGLGVDPREGFEEVKSFDVRLVTPLNQNSRPVVKMVLPESNTNDTDTKNKKSFFPRIYGIVK